MTENPQPSMKILALAALWPPFDPRSAVPLNPAPVPDGEIETLERQGFVVVTDIAGHPPYTHVITSGNHDYLAQLASPAAGTDTL